MGHTRITALLVAVLLVAPLPAVAEEKDPWESFNRKMFWFNDKLDVYALEPVARGWDTVMPDPVQRSLGNFFDNLRFPILLLNDLLQFKVKDSGVDVGRFAVNTTVGVAGLFDPATGWGLEKNDEDFGQTLGRWGTPSGPYLVLPFFGPSNPRDTVGLLTDSALTSLPFFFVSGIAGTVAPISAQAVNVTNSRSRILAEVEDAKEGAFDYYVFLRNAYVQRREALVEDREEMSDEAEEDLYTIDPTP